MQSESVEGHGTQQTQEYVARQVPRAHLSAEDDIADVAGGAPAYVLLGTETEPLVQAPLPAPIRMARTGSAEAGRAPFDLIIQRCDLPRSQGACAIIVQVEEQISFPV